MSRPGRSLARRVTFRPLRKKHKTRATWESHQQAFDHPLGGTKAGAFLTESNGSRRRTTSGFEASHSAGRYPGLFEANADRTHWEAMNETRARPITRRRKVPNDKRRKSNEIRLGAMNRFALKTRACIYVTYRRRAHLLGGWTRRTWWGLP